MWAGMAGLDIAAQTVSTSNCCAVIQLRDCHDAGTWKCCRPPTKACYLTHILE